MATTLDARLGYEPKRTWTQSEILSATKEQDIRFLRLQFTDIVGVNKNVEVPAHQFEKALDGQIMFDGSSIDGFVSIEESDMVLVPEFEHVPRDAVHAVQWTRQRAPTRSLGSSATSIILTEERSRDARASRSNV